MDLGENEKMSSKKNGNPKRKLTKITSIVTESLNGAHHITIWTA